MLNSTKINPNQIVLSFVWFFVGAIVCFFALNVMIVKPYTTKANEVMQTVFKDAKKLENYGAMTMVTQCKELGYAFVKQDNNTGFVIECDHSTVAEVRGDQLLEKEGQFREFSSKLSDRPLIVTPVIED